jgi:hypothetical protein
VFLCRMSEPMSWKTLPPRSLEPAQRPQFA